MNEMRENMLRRRENLKRQRQQDNGNLPESHNQNSNENGPENKAPRLSNTSNLDHGGSVASRKASRWETNEGGQDKRTFARNHHDGSSNENESKNRRPGDWDCLKCNKLQFAFRSSCKFCGISKDESEKMRFSRPQISQKDNKADNSFSNTHNTTSTAGLFITREDLKNSNGRYIFIAFFIPNLELL